MKIFEQIHYVFLPEYSVLEQAAQREARGQKPLSDACPPSSPAGPVGGSRFPGTSSVWDFPKEQALLECWQLLLLSGKHLGG